MPREQAIERRYEDFLHRRRRLRITTRPRPSTEIVEYIDDPVMRARGQVSRARRAAASRRPTGSYQEIGGRITRYPAARKREGAADAASRHHADASAGWTRWASTSPACSRRRCSISRLHPRVEVEVALARAYNRWLCEQHPRRGAAHQVDALSAVQRSRGLPTRWSRISPTSKGVIGFMVTSTHYKPRLRQRLHEDLRRAGGARPAARASTRATTGTTRACACTNRFIAVHALGFTWLQHAAPDQLADERHAGALPEAQDDLDRERARLGAVPDAAARQRIHDAHVGGAAAQAASRAITCARCIYTSQPMEMVDNRKALELTFKMINAETQLLYASDYPHWDMDLPSDDLRPAVPERAGQAQHPRRQCAAAVQPRAGALGDQAAAQGVAHAAAAGNQQGVRRRQRGGVSETLSRLMPRDASFGCSPAEAVSKSPG